MQDEEIRIFDLFFYVLSRWRLIILTTMVGVAVAASMYYFSGVTPKTQAISSERLAQLDEYARTLANIQVAQAEINVNGIEEEKSSSLALTLTQIEWDIRDMVKDNSEIAYLNAKINALKQGVEYNYNVPTNKSMAREILLVFCTFAVTIAYIVIKYIKINPFIFADRYGWKQYLVCEKLKNRDVIKRIRFKNEKIYTVDEASNVIVALLKRNNLSRVTIRGISDDKNATTAGKVLDANGIITQFETFDGDYRSVESVEKHFAPDAYVIIQYIDEKHDNQFIHEYEQNSFLHEKNIFVVSVI